MAEDFFAGVDNETLSTKRDYQVSPRLVYQYKVKPYQYIVYHDMSIEN